MIIRRDFANCRPLVSSSSSGTVCDMVDPEDENGAADGSRLGCECCRSAIGYCDIRCKNKILNGLRVNTPPGSELCAGEVIADNSR